MKEYGIVGLFRAHWHMFGFLSFMVSSMIQLVLNAQVEAGSFDPVLWIIGVLLFAFGAITLIDMTLRFLADALKVIERL